MPASLSESCRTGHLHMGRQAQSSEQQQDKEGGGFTGKGPEEKEQNRSDAGNLISHESSGHQASSHWSDRSELKSRTCVTRMCVKDWMSKVHGQALAQLQFCSKTCCLPLPAAPRQSREPHCCFSLLSHSTFHSRKVPGCTAALYQNQPWAQAAKPIAGVK